METPGTELAINLDQAVYVLSGGLDFVGIDDIQHGKRVAYMALETAQPLGLDMPTRLDLYYAALIHDLGVSSTEVHRHLVNELEWERADEHCDIAADLLQEFGPLAHLSGVLRYHHTHWEDIPSTPLSERDALLANLIFLCDRVDAIRAQRIQAGDRDPGAASREVIGRYRGTMFQPMLVDAFLDVSASPLFWERLAPDALENTLSTRYPPDPTHTINLEEVRHLGRLFAHVVDAKSPFTARHSEGVAQLSCYLARRMGLTEQELELIDVAALLHDLGKLRVPDAILEKPAPLDMAEQGVMRRHAHDSYDLLERIDGFREVARWAGMHHETPVGDGYPEDFRHEQLPLPARVISVADVFQALAQDRPYRRGLAPEEILPVLELEVERNHLDGEIVALVAEDLDQCWKVAVSGEEHCP